MKCVVLTFIICGSLIYGSRILIKPFQFHAEADLIRAKAEAADREREARYRAMAIERAANSGEYRRGAREALQVRETVQMEYRFTTNPPVQFLNAEVLKRLGLTESSK